ncbi:Aste57867_7983 [Aphanomyces stellatus]|uniref:Aste57867_7983 protein n=1 Tax=Aphanomyces stellatus TaxID=120398 RepID=A0A485KJ47_9STRA|nr:hypothetical protein As57867_007953 [Aphanomyces stellatus]VFT84876.1 Aste57867_7983 [Aphanomyces stellatus]
MHRLFRPITNATTKAIRSKSAIARGFTNGVSPPPGGSMPPPQNHYYYYKNRHHSGFWVCALGAGAIAYALSSNRQSDCKDRGHLHRTIHDMEDSNVDLKRELSRIQASIDNMRMSPPTPLPRSGADVESITTSQVAPTEASVDPSYRKERHGARGHANDPVSHDNDTLHRQHCHHHHHRRRDSNGREQINEAVRVLEVAHEDLKQNIQRLQESLDKLQHQSRVSREVPPTQVTPEQPPLVPEPVLCGHEQSSTIPPDVAATEQPGVVVVNTSANPSEVVQPEETLSPIISAKNSTSQAR